MNLKSQGNKLVWFPRKFNYEIHLFLSFNFTEKKFGFFNFHQSNSAAFLIFHQIYLTKLFQLYEKSEKKLWLVLQKETKYI